MQKKSNVLAEYLWFKRLRDDPWRIIEVYPQGHVREFGVEEAIPWNEYEGHFTPVVGPIFLHSNPTGVKKQKLEERLKTRAA